MRCPAPSPLLRPPETAPGSPSALAEKTLTHPPHPRFSAVTAPGLGLSRGRVQDKRQVPPAVGSQGDSETEGREAGG